jgi:hypothetical protein
VIRLLFIVVAFLLMIGGVLGGLYYWGIDPLAKVGINLGLTPATPAATAPAVVLPSYVDFGLLLVPVIQDREVKHQAEMILRLEVVPAKKDDVAADLPRLQAGFLEDMMGFLPMALRDSSELDIPAIRRRLQGVADRILGPGAVKDVIVENAELK